MAVYHCGLLPDHWVNPRKRYVRVSESLRSVFGLPISSEYLKKNKMVIHAGLSKFRPLTHQQLATLKFHIQTSFPFTEPMPSLNPLYLDNELDETDTVTTPFQNENSHSSNDVSRIVYVLNKHLSNISLQLLNVNENLLRIRANVKSKSKVICMQVK
jgi:hypothetical protein